MLVPGLWPGEYFSPRGGGGSVLVWGLCITDHEKNKTR